MPKLSVNGYWLFARYLRREMMKQGRLREYCSMPAFTPIASHYWEQLDQPTKEIWKREAKAYSKTPEFKARQERHRIHRFTDSERRRRRLIARRYRREADKAREEEADDDYDEEDDDEDGPQLIALFDHIEVDSAIGDSISGSFHSLLDIPDEAPLSNRLRRNPTSDNDGQDYGNINAVFGNQVTDDAGLEAFNHPLFTFEPRLMRS